MRLIYIANVRLPSEKAHGVNIVEMCQEFSRLSLNTELAMRNSPTAIKEDIFRFYSVKPIFRIKKLWCLDLVHYGRIGFAAQSITFAVSVFFYALTKSAIFYTRDELVALILKLMGKTLVWEAHMGQRNYLIKRLISLNTKIVAINKALKNLYISMGLKAENILVAPDAVDMNKFNLNLSKEEARKKLGLPMDKKIILYKGSLIKWKGTDTFIGAISRLPEQDFLFVIIGGAPLEIEDMKEEFKEIKNLIMLGHVPNVETAIYQKAADVLVLPNSGKMEVSRLYTSPMKLFEYMASGVPIVASDLPSVREIINESNAYFFTPDDSNSFARAIETVIRDYPEAQARATRAIEEVRAYSWSNRAKKILDFIK